MSALYIHSPFCASICPYCDFSVLVAPERLHHLWSDLVVQELKERIRQPQWQKLTVETLYLGGGTPSLLSPALLEQLVERVSGLLATPFQSLREVTIEANPESVDQQRIDCWKKLGFTRVSLGVQSGNDTILKAIGRNHSRQQAVEAMALLQQSGLRWSGDLMFALPGQRLADFEEDLELLLGMGVQHLSFYGLGIEPQTLFGQRAERGELTVDDELYRSCYLRGVGRCEAAGLRRYELSNFAVPGEEALHNQRYWSRTSYLGVGPGAHSFDGARLREANPKQFAQWKRGVERGESGWREKDLLGEKEGINEEIWLGLRVAQGIAVERIKEIIVNWKELERWINSGHLSVENGRLVAVGEGWLQLDSICSSLFV